MAMNLQQRQLQKQVLKMSQRQIHSLNILTMSTQDLNDELIKAAEDNPSLIISDEFKGRKRLQKESFRISSSSKEGELASENHQAALEAYSDNRKSITEHFLSQLNMLNLPPSEFELCEKLIYNLDSKGYHFLAPVSLLDKKNKSHTIGLLEKCMARIQQFDPPGLCVKNMEESLFIQAKQCGKAPELALFLLDGKLNYLDPLKTDKILAKIKKYLDNQKKMIGLTESSMRYTDFKLTESEIENALNFIRGLDPFPARDFSTVETHYISPDIKIEKIEDNDIPESGTIVEDNEIRLSITMTEDNMPQVSINDSDMKILESKELSEEERKELSEKIRKARELIEAIAYRQNTILRACTEIARIQIEFFKHGPGHLSPLKLQDIANKLGVHETTISRMSNSKYILCEWGLFNIKYFFTNVASTSDKNVSRDQVLHAIKQILMDNAGNKKISDQKIVEELEKKKIKIARRTVAKYRGLLNINSSYNR
ncbi:RNA polymerase factor sigma-54 [Treponema sp.]|uniref:RNA polymerase factor sigma-54 n=1 Tax=Treponema sp. TaxID=166 RepID=UPI00298DA2D7|nr:RNA polymerase factor sigma-54 [Treponema sp.]MCQ2240702.1 RNA polymerase factor sigma-54 [Treponema sp.]